MIFDCLVVLAFGFPRQLQVISVNSYIRVVGAKSFNINRIIVLSKGTQHAPLNKANYLGRIEPLFLNSQN
jgi:hypothetical protein